MRRGFAFAPGLARNLLRGRWLVITILVLLACGVMVRLGLWQLGRLEGRRAGNAVVAARMNAAPIPLDPGMATLDPAGLAFRRATVRGTWDYANEVVLRYRSFDGQPGVHALTPLLLDGGGAAVLVDRGWIPLQESDPEARRAYQTGTAADVQGIIFESHAQGGDAAGEQGRSDFFTQVDLDAIGRQVPYSLLPVYVRRLPAGANVTPPRAEGLPELGNGPHLSYTIQWFAFAATLFVTYLLFANHTMSREGQRRRRPLT